MMAARQYTYTLQTVGLENKRFLFLVYQNGLHSTSPNIKSPNVNWPNDTSPNDS
jgi:hypothetical protein